MRPVIRCAAGLIVFYHGLAGIGHADAVTASMTKNRFAPPVSIAHVVTLTEAVGALCVAIGFFARFFAAIGREL